MPGFQLSTLVEVGAVVLSACTSSDSLARQANAGDNKNFISGGAPVAQYATAERKQPVVLEGELFDGTAVESTAGKGKLVVLNLWYAPCFPCRMEAPRLAVMYQESEPEGAVSAE